MNGVCWGYMKNRKRTFAAIIRDNHILMVRVVNGMKDFWTLPGGGLENSETYEEAVVREVLEEINLKVSVVKHLFTDTYENGTQTQTTIKRGQVATN